MPEDNRNNLEILCQLDPEHFLAGGGGTRWRKSPNGHCWIYFREITWEIAGWMLTRMNERYEVVRTAYEGEYIVLEEESRLYHIMRTQLLDLSAEAVADLYIWWRQSPDLGNAPAAGAISEGSELSQKTKEDEK